MASARPEALAPLPAFPDDQLDPARSGGDLFVQIGADDPLVTVHALRTLQRLAQGEAKIRWTMSGFTSAPEGASPGGAHRNLMGHLDGTASPHPPPPAARPCSAAAGPTTTASAPTEPPTPECSSSPGRPTPAPAGATPGTYIGQALFES